MSKRLRVSRELRVSQPEIADELGLAMLEQKAGKPREDTLKDMAERTNVPSVRALVNTLVQSDVFGASIAKTLRVYSDVSDHAETSKFEHLSPSGELAAGGVGLAASRTSRAG